MGTYFLNYFFISLSNIIFGAARCHFVNFERLIELVTQKRFHVRTAISSNLLKTLTKSCI